jgi:ceramide glucosyltransferase
MSLNQFIGSIGMGVIALSAGYATVTLAAATLWRVRRQVAQPMNPASAVSVLKPLCGAEPGLYENLRSLFMQNCRGHQIIFGVRDAADPALIVVERLAREFPDRAVDIFINGHQHGSNRKVSNLINMLAHARHNLLLISDSDVLAGPDYVAAAAAPLMDRSVGLVACLYHCAPTTGIWSRLGAMYSNDWYIPSVLLSRLFGHRGYASGAALCLRRETLRDLGGFASIADHLADDYRLGELVRGLGQRIVLSPYALQLEHHETTLKCLVAHELRWMRTLRTASAMFSTVVHHLHRADGAHGCGDGSHRVPGVHHRSGAARNRGRGAASASLPSGAGAREQYDAQVLAATRVRSAGVLGLVPRIFKSRVRWRGAELEVDASGMLRGHG